MAAQLTLFDHGTAARPVAVSDLEGILAGPGHVVRRGDAARVASLLPWPDPWRLEAIVAEGGRLGVEVGEAPTGGTFVRTGFTPELLQLAQRWTRGAVKHPPDTLLLDGPRLRWWFLVAGRVAPGPPAAVLLALDPERTAWEPVLGCLAVAGLTATLLHGRRQGPTVAARVNGARRLRRLAEMIGDRPGGWPVREWPGS